MIWLNIHNHQTGFNNFQRRRKGRSTMSKVNYQYIETGNFPIKAWVNGVKFEDEARKQLENIATLPFIFKHIVVMPDVHKGIGSTVGSLTYSQR